MPDFNSPEIEWGGADPRSYEHPTTGDWWHGALQKDASGNLRLVVYRTSAAGALLSTWADSGITGQGGLVLQANGRLDACGFVQQGMNATRRCVPVPGWVRPVPSGGLSARYQEALARLCELLRI